LQGRGIACQAREKKFALSVLAQAGIQSLCKTPAEASGKRICRRSTLAGTTDDFLRWLEEGLNAMCRARGSLPAGLLHHVDAFSQSLDA
jgi:hypothetical protein